MKSHISVTQRLNLLGIGAGAKQGAEDIAWKQNRDYELVLARLNATAERTAGGDERTVVEMEISGVVAEGGFVKADSGRERGAKEQDEADEGDLKEKEKKKKRKKDGKEDDGKDKSEKKKSKKRRKEEDNADEEQPEPSKEKETPVVTPSPIRAPVARPMA